MFKFVVTENLNVLKNTNCWKLSVLVIFIELFIKFNAHVHYIKKICNLRKGTQLSLSDFNEQYIIL